MAHQLVIKMNQPANLAPICHDRKNNLKGYRAIWIQHQLRGKDSPKGASIAHFLEKNTPEIPNLSSTYGHSTSMYILTATVVRPTTSCMENKDTLVLKVSFTFSFTTFNNQDEC